MLALDFDQWMQIAQTALIAVGGFWAIYLYWRSRKGQASVGIESQIRLHRDPRMRHLVLLTWLRVSNSSSVLFRYEAGTATLLDASQRTDEGDLRLVPFAEDDSFIPLYGEISTDPEAIRDGRLFHLENAGVSLEPGEFVDTELALILEPDDLGLMAMQVMIKGKRGRWKTVLVGDLLLHRSLSGQRWVPRSSR